MDSAPFFGGSKGCNRHFPVAPVAPHERAEPGTAVSSVHRIGSARPVEQPETQHNPSPHGEVVLADVANGRAPRRFRARGHGTDVEQNIEAAIDLAPAYARAACC